MTRSFKLLAAAGTVALIAGIAELAEPGCLRELAADVRDYSSLREREDRERLTATMLHDLQQQRESAQTPFQLITSDLAEGRISLSEAIPLAEASLTASMRDAFNSPLFPGVTREERVGRMLVLWVENYLKDQPERAARTVAQLERTVAAMFPPSEDAVASGPQ